MKRTLLITTSMTVLAFFLLTAESCDEQSTTDKESLAQQAATGEANAKVGFPSTPNWTEKTLARMIIEKRDQPHLQTYTYFVGVHNEHTPLCRSEGYGLPETTQFTAPSSVQRTAQTGNSNWEILPQADPNGLYSSPSAQGTWVLCLEKSGKVEPQRSEPNVVTLSVPWDQLDQSGM